MAAEAFLRLRTAAQKDGIDLQPFSAFRDFRTQRRIWNKKFSGEKPLYDMKGEIVDALKLNDKERVRMILGWSAIPGASRHHWGTEFDVIDRAVMPQDYRVRLLPEEIQKGGIFEKLHKWLDQNISDFGFFRPYRTYRGGMFPEPWQLSYAPLSEPFLKQVNVETLRKAIRSNPILGADTIDAMMPWILERHVLEVDGQP